MLFLNPYLFWILIVPFLFFAFMVSTNKEQVSRVFDEEVLKRLKVADVGIPKMMRHMLMFVAIFFMIVAMARPVVEKGDKSVDIEGLTVLTALDISGSMRSNDLYPSRLEFAKKKMGMFFDAMPNDIVGVVAFAYSPFVLAPFSSDKDTLKMMIDGVDSSYINMGSTDYLALGELASSLLEEKSPKLLVVFSDGGDKESISGLKDKLQESDIDLYVVLVGTSKGAPVLDENGKAISLKDGTIAITQRNDALGEITKELNGAFVVASNSKEDVVDLASLIKSRYKNQQQGEVSIKDRVEYFYYPLALGLLFLLLSLSSLPKKEER